MNNPATKFILTPQGPYAFTLVHPPWLESDDPIVQDQAATGLWLLQVLNESVSGCPCGPFRELIILNDPELADAAEPDHAYWWGIN